LFSTRGFETRVFGGSDGVGAFVRRSRVEASVALVDFVLPDAHRILGVLRQLPRPPAIVGVVDDSELLMVQHQLDAAFARPVDPARLFVRIVALAARAAGQRRTNRITGVIGVVGGNALFERVTAALRPFIAAVNAGPVVEQVMQALGAEPTSMSEADLSAAVASGRMTEALARFVGPVAARDGVGRLGDLLEELRRRSA
jgi:hypothetical protein